MQDNSQEESIQSGRSFFWYCCKEIFSFFTFLIKKSISHTLEKFITPSGIWSIFILILFLLFFIFDDFRNKYSNWFFESIGAVTGKSSTSGDIHINGSVDATVSRPFRDAAQACWYYHANYKNSHAYTVLWKKSKEKGVYPIIRVIAEPARWQAEKCIKEKGGVKLIGIEYTKHSIEAQFGKGEDFVKIDTSKAYYRSALFFDKEGRITERKVLSNKDKKEIDFEYESSPHLCDVIKKATNRREIKCSERQEKYTFKSLKKESDNFNILQIGYDPNRDRNPKNLEKYHEAIILYIKEREKLHTELVKTGCGAISVEPELTDDSGNLFKTSIAFLCLKKSGKQSHVRLMHRVSEQKF